MNQQQLAASLEALKHMEELELTMAELYQSCAQLWPEHEEFWMDIQQAEVKHAHNINRMRKIISERPENFGTGRSFQPVVIKTFIAGIKSNIQNLKKKEMNEVRALFLARSIEQAYLASKYTEIAKTEDKEFQSLMREIYSETVFHREHLNKRIREFTSDRVPGDLVSQPLR